MTSRIKRWLDRGHHNNTITIVAKNEQQKNHILDVLSGQAIENDAVILNDGKTYDLKSIQSHIEKGNTFHPHSEKQFSPQEIAQILNRATATRETHPEFGTATSVPPENARFVGEQLSTMGNDELIARIVTALCGTQHYNISPTHTVSVNKEDGVSLERTPEGNKISIFNINGTDGMKNSPSMTLPMRRRLGNQNTRLRKRLVRSLRR